jgi:hypothetical protein
VTGRCVTNTGKRIWVTVTGQLNGDQRTFRRYHQQSRKITATAPTHYGDAGRYCKRGDPKSKGSARPWGCGSAGQVLHPEGV